jgi:hypothetical protein
MGRDTRKMYCAVQMQDPNTLSPTPYLKHIHPTETVTETVTLICISLLGLSSAFRVPLGNRGYRS